jgi:ABC-2 type transport system permease protein
LGWQIESNWADPFLFAIYSIVRPLSSAAILVVMYSVVSQANFTSPVFPYIYLGNAFYTFVGSVMNGTSFTVINDREDYRTIKYIYTAPVSYPLYLVGRAVAQFIIAAISVMILILFGVFFLHLRIDLAAVDWPLFLISLITGIAMLVGMGLILAGVMLLVVNHMYVTGDAVAAALYLFSGAIFPLSVLPPFLRWIGYVMPLTYWLELLRRSLVGSVAEAFPTLSGLSNVQLYGILIGLTGLFLASSRFIFRWCEQKARERGLIDTITNY